MHPVDIADLARASPEIVGAAGLREVEPSERALVLRLPDGRVVAICDAQGDEPVVRIPDLGVFELRDGRLRAHVVAGDPRVGDALDRIARPLLCQAAGAEVMHASAARFADGVVALCGIAGTGKSTLAHVLSARGHSLWADDALVVIRDDDAFASIALPFRPRPGREVIRRWPTPGPASTAPGTQAPLRAIVCLVRDDDRPSPAIARLPRAAAFRAIVAHAYAHGLGDAGRNAALFDSYVDVAASVPAWELRFAHDLDALPELAARIEDVAAS